MSAISYSTEAEILLSAAEPGTEVCARGDCSRIRRNACQQRSNLGEALADIAAEHPNGLFNVGEHFAHPFHEGRVARGLEAPYEISCRVALSVKRHVRV